MACALLPCLMSLGSVATSSDRCSGESSVRLLACCDYTPSIVQNVQSPHGFGAGLPICGAFLGVLGWLCAVDLQGTNS